MNVSGNPYQPRKPGGIANKKRAHNNSDDDDDDDGDHDVATATSMTPKVAKPAGRKRRASKNNPDTDAANDQGGIDVETTVKAPTKKRVRAGIGNPRGLPKGSGMKETSEDKAMEAPEENDGEEAEDNSSDLPTTEASTIILDEIDRSLLGYSLCDGICLCQGHTGALSRGMRVSVQDLRNIMSAHLLCK